MYNHSKLDPRKGELGFSARENPIMRKTATSYLLLDAYERGKLHASLLPAFSLFLVSRCLLDASLESSHTQFCPSSHT